MKQSRLVQFAFLFVIVATFALPKHAYAGLLCRSDPVVLLSNGMVLDIAASISTLPMQVKEVHYELRVPVGVKAILALQIPTWITSRETFTVIADQPANSYVVTTTVYTKTGNADVSAETILLSPFRIKLGAYAAKGKEGQALTVWFRG